MSNTKTADNLASGFKRSIDQHAGKQPVGKIESHDLQSLSKRILCPPNVVVDLIAAGVLQPVGPVYGNQPQGPQTWNSDDLNEVRKAALGAVVEKVVSESDGNPDEVNVAGGEALRQHVKSFETPANGAKNLSRALSSGAILFAQPGDDEQPGTFQRAATTAAKVGAIGAAGYGAAALLRGKYLKPTAGLWDQFRSGALSSGAAKVAAILAGKKLPVE